MRNQKCLIYKRCIVTDPPQKEANNTYKCFDIACHESIKIENEKLKYTPSSIDIQTILPTKICQNVSNENRLQKCKHTSAKADKEQDTSYSATSSYETSTNSSTSLQDVLIHQKNDVLAVLKVPKIKRLWNGNNI